METKLLFLIVFWGLLSLGLFMAQMLFGPGLLLWMCTVITLCLTGINLHEYKQIRRDRRNG